MLCIPYNSTECMPGVKGCMSLPVQAPRVLSITWYVAQGVPVRINHQVLSYYMVPDTQPQENWSWVQAEIWLSETRDIRGGRFRGEGAACIRVLYCLGQQRGIVVEVQRRKCCTEMRVHGQLFENKKAEVRSLSSYIGQNRRPLNLEPPYFFSRLIFGADSSMRCYRRRGR